MQFSLDLDDGHETDTAPMLYEFCINMNSGQTGVRSMDKALYGDFPVIPARFAGALLGNDCLPVAACQLMRCKQLWPALTWHALPTHRAEGTLYLPGSHGREGVRASTLSLSRCLGTN